MSLDEALTARMARRKLAHAYLITGRDRSALPDTLAAALVRADQKLYEYKRAAKIGR